MACLGGQPEKSCSMNSLKVQSALVFLALSIAGHAQEINTLVPWSFAPAGVKMGMSAQDLRTRLPHIKPLLGMFDKDPTGETESSKDGMYAARSDEGGYNEAMAYGVTGGRVTQVYWSSKTMASIEDVQSIRNQLSKVHGDARIGYKAKVTKDGIAKITTEVFTVKDTDLTISLSSALGETEVAVLDTSEPQVDINELYFSFEKQRDRLRKELLRLTKEAPQEEPPSTTLDVLQEVIAADGKQENEPSSSEGTASYQAPPDTAPDRRELKEDTIQNFPEGRSRPSAIHVAIALFSAFILAVAFVIFSKRRRGNG